MAAMNFPSNPTVGQTYDFAPYKYVWDGEKWKTIGVGNNPAVEYLTTTRSNLKRLAAEAGVNLVDGSFEESAVVTDPNDVVWFRNEGTYYGWGGTIPVGGKTIPAGSTPTTAGGIGAGAWSDKTDMMLRETLASDGGAQRVHHKSSIANAVNQALSDILELQSITPEQFGAAMSYSSATAATDTASMQAAFAFALLAACKIDLSRIYKINTALNCYYVQTHNKAFSLVGKHQDCGFEWFGSTASQYVIDVHGYGLHIENVTGIESSANINTNTFVRVCGERVKVKSVFNKGRWYKGVLGVACLSGSEFVSIDSDLDNTNTVSAKTGVPLQLVSCVNATVMRGISKNCAYPVVVAALSEGPEALKPPSFTQTITWGNEGVCVIGMKSTNTTNGPKFAGLELTTSGCVFDLIYDRFMIIDGSFMHLSDNWFGANNATPATADIFAHDSTNGAYINLKGNTISCGAATVATTAAVISDTFTYAYSEFSSNLIENWTCLVSGTNRITSIGNNAAILPSTPDVALTNSNANNVFIANQRKSRLSEGLILGKDTPDGDGKLQIRANSSERLFNGLTASGTILSTCPGGLGVNTTTPASAAVMYIGSMSSSGRSINAVGTVNASGADYAEYVKKSEKCGSIEKGAIVGIDANAELTDVFDDAVSFVIKSTDPALVGGDTWGKDLQYPDYPSVLEPSMPMLLPRRFGQSDEDYAAQSDEVVKTYNNELSEFNSAISKYADDVAKYDAAYEAERIKYDRIAFSGQVPCLVSKATAGDYIVPRRSVDGGIYGESVKNPSFAEYAAAIGKVWKVLSDDAAWVAVKIG